MLKLAIHTKMVIINLTIANVYFNRNANPNGMGLRLVLVCFYTIVALVDNHHDEPEADSKTGREMNIDVYKATSSQLQLATW